jgi:hypothetical protein
MKTMVALFLAWPLLVRSAQSDFARLTALQKALYERTGGTAESYASLSMSQKSTFEAVTNALQRSTLTDTNGKRLGSVLEYVVKIESIAGETKGTGGDKQFRIYAEVKPETRDVLDHTREFFRDKDNTVFHKDYPLNFRQRGRAPTIQVSMARESDRVDIDVDYRSSKPPQSLFNGHLSAANSDVRAGRNYPGHVHRWQGLMNWWKLLFKPSASQEPEAPEAPAVADSVDTPAGRTISDLGEATEEFFTDWLVRRKVGDAQGFLSRNATACVNDDDDEENENLNSSHAAALFRRILESAIHFEGQHSSIEAAIRPVPATQSEFRPASHRHEGAFSLYEVPMSEVAEFTCRAQSSLRSNDQTSRQYDGHYEAIFRFAGQDRGSSGLILLWSKENGGWRIISFDQLEE